MPLAKRIRDYILTAQGDFNQLALAVFLHQYLHCHPYQRYCRQQNITPDQIQDWREIPAVSTDVFREVALCTLPISSAQHIFHTSGTSAETKGKHYYHDMSLYHAAIQSSFMQGIGLSNQHKPIFRVLTPSFAEVQSSSLYYMFQKVLEWYGDTHSKFYFRQNALDCKMLSEDLLHDIAAERPIVLLGTAFAFVNFCDYLTRNQIHLKLPRDSRLLETGGLKGRSRTLTRDALYQLFSEKLGVALTHCFSEYGMTELSSQCYSKPNSHLFQSPHWMRTRIIDPLSEKEVAVGKQGLVQFFDLANETAISAIITSDLAVKQANGFELVGRASKAVLRGCSTAFEEYPSNAS